jgi:hypothetical protein
MLIPLDMRYKVFINRITTLAAITASENKQTLSFPTITIEYSLRINV